MLLFLNSFNALKLKYLEEGTGSPCYYYILSFCSKKMTIQAIFHELGVFLPEKTRTSGCYNTVFMKVAGFPQRLLSWHGGLGN